VLSDTVTVPGRPTLERDNVNRQIGLPTPVVVADSAPTRPPYAAPTAAAPVIRQLSATIASEPGGVATELGVAVGVGVVAAFVGFGSAV
jgi:hypothetical protein